MGHAIEYLSKYKLSHGEAISIGMVLANKIAQKLGKQSKKTGERIKTMLHKYDLPTEIPKSIKLTDMIDLVYRDKKMSGDYVSFILSTGMGQYDIVKLKPKEIMKLLR